MITITPAAAEHINRLLAKKVNALGFRISIEKAGCTGYKYVPEIIEETRQNDIKLATEFGFDLYIDEKYSEFLRGTCIDFVRKDFGLTRLEFHNPNARSLCGCGESFNL